MTSDDIMKGLAEINIAAFKDSCNPDFTVHLDKTGDQIDSIDFGPDKRWQFISLDRKKFIDLNSVEQLKEVVLEHIASLGLKKI